LSFLFAESLAIWLNLWVFRFAFFSGFPLRFFPVFPLCFFSGFFVLFFLGFFRFAFIDAYAKSHSKK
jgi:hypothetical protein